MLIIENAGGVVAMETEEKREGRKECCLFGTAISDCETPFSAKQLFPAIGHFSWVDISAYVESKMNLMQFIF